MGDSPSTRASLLVRIRDAADSAAWSYFVEIYTPVIYGAFRRGGLQDADAADLTQDVLRIVASEVHRLEYDASRGSFRGWLCTVTRNRLRNFWADPRRREQAVGGSAAWQQFDQQAATVDEEEVWRHDYQRRVFAWAANQVRQAVKPETWQAFWHTTVERQSGEEVAKSLNMSVAAVYLAKSRVMARLREAVAQCDAD
jgi:RNA polymerase sigma-70 factor (ECF subfamily)